MSTADPSDAAFAQAIQAIANEAFLAPLAGAAPVAPRPDAVPAIVPPGGGFGAAPSFAPFDPPASVPSGPTRGLVPGAAFAAPIDLSGVGPAAHPFAGAAPASVTDSPFTSGPPGAGVPVVDGARGGSESRVDAGAGDDLPYFLSIAGLPGGAQTAPREAAPRFEYAPEAAPAVTTTRGIFDPHAIKRDFPILAERVHGRPLVWLDNAATTQKPRVVIERLTHFYEHENSNVHRAAHTLAGRATDAYEGARESVRRFLHAPSSQDIVFVRGATEAINLVAQSWGRRNVGAGDEIVVTHLEHHANIVPWQRLCAETGARLRVAPVDDSGQILLEEYEKLLSPRTRLVAFTQVSNALGTITPAREMVAIARRHGAAVLVDGAQAVSHMPVDVQDLDCDFYVLSGHKVFAPTGIGALYGKKSVLEAMPPWQGGGNMIADVTFEKTVYQPPPWRFEAGTGNIADAVGLGAALDYLSGIGLENVSRYEHGLRLYGEACLSRIEGVHLIGSAHEKAGVIPFVLDGVKTEEVSGMLDQEGIAVRSGHHCAQPILRRFGLEATVRASLAPYNTTEDLDALAAAVRRILLARRS